ncbi:hypothetical protein PT974_07864 [Cladobotryum mycophilum]|uniref:Uncharacterized protein n=1 Tax=Cladobotryum mycophilum TaxID=491253 RepID=A0ABR0SCT0_9HYPO
MIAKSVAAALALAVASTSAAPVDNAGLLSFNVITSDYKNADGVRLQLRPNQYETEYGFPAGSFFYLGVDKSSYNLVGTIQDGSLISWTSGPTNDKIGYLSLKEQWDDGKTSQYIISFGNPKLYANATDNQWSLNDKVGVKPILVHGQDVNLTGRFQLCNADFNTKAGSWQYLSYITYDKAQGLAHNIPGCIDAAVLIGHDY